MAMPAPPLPKRRHNVAGEPAELLLELAGRDALRPVDHEMLEAGILGLDRADAGNHLVGRAAEPRLLLDAALEARHPRRCSACAPRPPVLVGIAHEAERREPLVTLIMRRLDAAHRRLARLREVEAGAPDHVLA